MNAARLRVLLKVGFLLAVVVVLPAGSVFRMLRQNRLDAALIQAIQQKRTAPALALLTEGADPDACVTESPASFWEMLQQHWVRMRGKTAPPQNGDSALMLAVQTDQEPVTLALLKRSTTGVNAMVNIQDSYSFYPLLLAATAKGRMETATALLDKGADINARGTDEQTALLIALSESPSSASGTSAEKAVSQNLAHSRFALAHLFVERGADVNAQNKRTGETPLLNAAGANQTALVQLLLDKGADTNPLDTSDSYDCWSPLDWAAYYNNVGMVKNLLDKGAAVNPTEAQGDPPLLATCDADVMRLLLDRGAKIEARRTRGKHGGSTALIDVSSTEEIDAMRLLLNRGANVNAADDYGETALSEAALYSDAPILRLLLRRGARVNDSDNDRTTALMWAASDGNDENCEVLIAGGARVNLSNGERETALMLAADNGDDSVIETLLDGGAAINLRDKHGRTALDHAIENDNTAVIAQLKRMGGRR